jgi:hypothetical protein
MFKFLLKHWELTFWFSATFIFLGLVPISIIFFFVMCCVVLPLGDKKSNTILCFAACVWAEQMHGTHNTPQGPLMDDEWVNKIWFIHTMEYYPDIKRNEAWIYATTWINLETIMVRSQLWKTTHSMILFIWNF